MPYQKTNSSALILAHDPASRSEKISVSCSVRPPRVGFVVDPKNEKSVLDAILINSVLWGGLFNPIIPLFNSRPRWWSLKDSYSKPDPCEIFQAYLDVFEPDVIVAFENDVYKRIPIGDTPIRKSYVHEPNDPTQYGVTAERFYMSAHREIASLPEKIRPKLLLPRASAPAQEMLMHATYGGYPSDWRILREQVKELFDFEQPQLLVDGYDFSDGKNLTALQLTTHGLKFQMRNEEVLFLLDGTNKNSIIDYWNLRACGWDIRAYDVNWNLSEKKLLAFCSTENANVTFMPARQLSDAVAEAVYSSIKGKTITVQHYPRFIAEWERRADDFMRPVVDAGNWSLKVDFEDSEIKFDHVQPDIRVRSTSKTTTDCVAVLNYKNARENLVAAVMPYGFSHGLRNLASDSLWAPRFTSEGLAVARRSNTKALYLRLPSSFDCVQNYFRRTKYEVELSPGAIIARELMASVGNLHGLNAYANADVLKLFEELNIGTWIGRSAFVGRLNKAFRRKDIGPKLIDDYVAHRAVTLGLTLRCSHCEQSGWYELKQLAPLVHCSRCLRQFSFPAARPPGPEAWSYRPAGCFAVSGFAHGAYSVCFTAKFLLQGCAAKGTWFPGMKVRQANDRWREIDLVMFWQDLDRLAPREIFAECKTFGEFKSDDFERAEWIHEHFPDAVVVFSTLRETITQEEIRNLRRLCNQKRRRWRHDKNKLGILVLTGHELFSSLPPPLCWRGKAENYKWIEGQFNDTMNMSLIDRLCDITQQLHLGLPRYFDYIDDFNKKRCKKKKASND